MCRQWMSFENNARYRMLLAIFFSVQFNWIIARDARTTQQMEIGVTLREYTRFMCVCYMSVAKNIRHNDEEQQRQHHNIEWEKQKIDFQFTFVFGSVHDPDAIKTAGEPALLWVMAFCTGLFGGRICDVPPIVCDCGCAAENWWNYVNIVCLHGKCFGQTHSTLALSSMSILAAL